jgi:lysophospholipase L1-like esterase
MTFAGRAAISIPAGADVVSDPLNVTIPPLADVAIDLFLPNDTNTPSFLTMHNDAFQTNYASTSGNHLGEAAFPVASTFASWFLLSRLDLTAAAGAVVTMGASLTDGRASTVDANRRWPDVLAKRLQAQSIPLGVLNAGIAGNRLMNDGSVWSRGISGLARLDRDVLLQPGVTYVIVADMALNDVGMARESAAPDVDDLIWGQKQLIERAHARGLKVYGATLTPFEGASYYTAVGEAKRQAVNQWIRTGGAYDGVIDFDAAIGDQNNRLKMRPDYDSGDHLHPNDAGYNAMADAIDLNLFKSSAIPPSAKR